MQIVSGICSAIETCSTFVSFTVIGFLATGFIVVFATTMIGYSGAEKKNKMQEQKLQFLSAVLP